MAISVLSIQYVAVGTASGCYVIRPCHHSGDVDGWPGPVGCLPFIFVFFLVLLRWSTFNYGECFIFVTKLEYINWTTMGERLPREDDVCPKAVMIFLYAFARFALMAGLVGLGWLGGGGAGWGGKGYIRICTLEVRKVLFSSFAITCRDLKLFSGGAGCEFSDRPIPLLLIHMYVGLWEHVNSLCYPS